MRFIGSRSSVPSSLAAACCLSVAVQAFGFQAERPISSTDAAAGRSLAEAFVGQVNGGDVAAASVRIDWAAILIEATRGIGETGPGADLRRQFVNQFLQDLEESGGLVAQVSQVVEQGGGYKFLRMYDQAPLRGVVRLLPPAGGVNYHTLYFAEDDEGQHRIVDIGVAVSGERLTQTLRRGFLALLAESEGDWSPFLTETEQLYAEHVTDLRAMAVALSQEELGRVDGLYGELPSALQRDHGVLMLRLQSARVRGVSEFAAALAAMRGDSESSVAANLFAIDGWLQLNRPDAALESIELIETAVGGDPYLQVVRGDVQYRAGNLEAAELAARRAIEEDPDLQNAYWQLTTISLDQGDFETTADMLTRIAQRFDIEFQDLRDVPEYNEFVRSAEYRAWRRTRSR